MNILVIKYTVRYLVCAAVLASLGNFANAYKPEIGDKPSKLQDIEYVDGTPIDLKKLQGKPVVLYFGGDWCAPCVERGRPAALAAARKYGPQGLKVIFVSMDDNNMRQQKIQESEQLDISIAMPTMNICPPGSCFHGIKSLGEQFGRIYVFPTAVVLDANGVVQAKMDRGMGVQGGLDGAVLKVMTSAGLLQAK